MREDRARRVEKPELNLSVHLAAAYLPGIVPPNRTAASSPERGTHQRIHDVVSRIPRGRVATYGQIARLAGLRGQARLVGYALHALPAGTRVKWQRVVNSKGEISLPGQSAARQRTLLEQEGVRFDARGRISLDKYLWQPKSRTDDE